MSADEAIIINCETSSEIRIFLTNLYHHLYWDREPLGIKTLSDLIVKSDAVIENHDGIKTKNQINYYFHSGPH